MITKRRNFCQKKNEKFAQLKTPPACETQPFQKKFKFYRNFWKYSLPLPFKISTYASEHDLAPTLLIRLLWVKGIPLPFILKFSKSFTVFCCCISASNLEIKNFHAISIYCLIFQYCPSLIWTEIVSSAPLSLHCL